MTFIDVAPIRFVDLASTHSEIRSALDAIWHDTLQTNGFIGGCQVETFEAEFAAYCGTESAIGVANGTDALELILRGLDIGPGDEVIVPANTFIATAEAVASAGAKPVFTDVDKDTALITGSHVRDALSPRTAAVIAVHLYGQMVDMDDLLSVAAPAGIAVIEDAAQAHGATWKGRRAGSFGIAAGFSFYPGKNLGAMGDGGAVTTSDPGLARRIRSIANHGRSAQCKYSHDVIGRNSRLDGLQAGVLRVKLSELDRWNDQRRRVAERYLARMPDCFVPYADTTGSRSVFHLFVVRSVERSRQVVGESLDAHKIQWGIHYPVPCHRQRPFASTSRSVLAVAESHASQILSLPIHPHLTASEIERICGVLERFA
jgi:dTDP-4-amino-4,6-dideoxygalactose transaminase